MQPYYKIQKRQLSMGAESLITFSSTHFCVEQSLRQPQFIYIYFFFTKPRAFKERVKSAFLCFDFGRRAVCKVDLKITPPTGGPPNLLIDHRREYLCRRFGTDYARFDRKIRRYNSLTCTCIIIIIIATRRRHRDTLDSHHLVKSAETYSESNSRLGGSCQVESGEERKIERQEEEKGEKEVCLVSRYSCLREIFGFRVQQNLKPRVNLNKELCMQCEG